MSTLPLQPSDEPCPICGRFKIAHGRTGFLTTVSCPLCGQYNLSERLKNTVSREKPNRILSGITRNHWERYNTELSISCDNFESLASFIDQSPIQVPNESDIPAKADLILHYLRRHSLHPGFKMRLSGIKDYSLGFCQNCEELHFCAKYLEKRGLIEPTDPAEGADLFYRITPAGWIYLSGIGAETKDQGFIAMAFRLPTSDVLHTDGLTPGIENAGYNPLRIDRKDHNNRIDDEIVAEIRKSKFVVADLTGKNAGAYFEAGFAKGLDKPVFWTCQQSEIDAGNVHFDTRQYSIVSWESDKLDDFAKRLTQRIEATIGHGPKIPVPATK